MSMNPLMFPHVPLIGTKDETSPISFVPVFTIQCHCVATSYVTIRSLEGGTKCNHCGRIYYIGAINFDRKTNNCNISIGCDVDTPLQLPQPVIQ